MSTTEFLADPEFAAIGLAANGAVGFGFMKVIFDSIAELSKTNPAKAERLAEAGAYWAGNLAQEMTVAQDALEDKAGRATA